MAENIKLLTQYIKDLSFENYAAQKNRFSKKEPDVHIDIKINKKMLKTECIEITMITLLEAKNASEKLFLIELSYAASFKITGLENLDQNKRIVFVECPTIMFPFIRHILFNITRDSGFPPINLNYVDFEALFKKQTIN